MTKITYFQNPMGVYFGATLKKWRAEKFERSIEIAKKLEIAHSLYRMIETGSAPLNPERIIKLYKAFPDKNINFEGTAGILAAIKYTNNCKNKEEFMQASINIIGVENKFLPLINEINENYKTLEAMTNRKRGLFILQNNLEKPLEDLILKR